MLGTTGDDAVGVVVFGWVVPENIERLGIVGVELPDTIGCFAPSVAGVEVCVDMLKFVSDGTAGVEIFGVAGALALNAGTPSVDGVDMLMPPIESGAAFVRAENALLSDGSVGMVVIG